MADLVNHPPHYASGGVECIDAIEEATKDLQGIEAVCTANVLKYCWRWKKKNGLEDLKKAEWYLKKLISKNELGTGSTGSKAGRERKKVGRTKRNSGQNKNSKQ